MLGRKIYRKLYQISEFLNQHIISILLTLLVVGIGVGLFGSYHLTINLVNSQAEQNASVSINTNNETRRLYSERVVEPLPRAPHRMLQASSPAAPRHHHRS